MLTSDELMNKSAAYQYGYQDATTDGAVPCNLWAGDPDYKWAADDYEAGYNDGCRDADAERSDAD